MDRLNQFILSHRVARLATVDKLGRPLVVPICYVYDGKNLYSPIDKKPKLAPARDIKRIRNIIDNPFISVVIDDYDEDWNKLCYVIIHGRAELLESGEDYQMSLKLLCEKYPQYLEMNLSSSNLPVIKVIPARILSWGAI